MGLEDLLESDEEVEWEGPRVEYNDKEYHVYVTNKRLILHEERGFFSKSDDIVSWDFEQIKKADYKEAGAMGSVVVETEEEEIEISGVYTEASNLLAKIRARIS